MGLDLARPRLLHARPALWRPTLWLAAVLLAGLAIAALRIDLFPVRYGLSEALAEERELLEQRRVELARVGSLRDPARLGELARQRGFGPPERVVELPPHAGVELPPVAEGSP